MVRLAVLAVLMTMPTLAAWERYVNTRELPDSPPPHPLAYFRVHPCLRSDRKDRVLQCFADGKPPSTTFKLIRTELIEAGKIGSFDVWDLNYFFDAGHSDINYFDMRSVLVQTGSDEFHEIYVIENE